AFYVALSLSSIRTERGSRKAFDIRVRRYCVALSVGHQTCRYRCSKNRRGRRERRKLDGMNKTVRMIVANFVHPVRTSVTSVVDRLLVVRRGPTPLQHSCAFVSIRG